jgi:GT2 family glycosyltransferase
VQPAVSVIIAAWNAEQVLGACLDSVLAQEIDGGLETIVVDNASTDGTRALLAEYGDRVTTIANESNVGFSAACNQGAREARADILFFLNPDTELLAPDTVARLAAVLGDPAVGLAGPMLLNPDGSLQPSCAPQPSIRTALVVSSGLHRILPRRWLARVAPQFWQHDRPLDTGWLMGAALAIRAELFSEVGEFAPVMYLEDQELARQVARRGLRVRYDNSARVMHVGNYAGAQRWSDPEREARVAHAELIYLQAHCGRVRATAVRTIVWSGYVLRGALHAALGHGSRAAVFRSMARVYAGRAR